LPPATHTLSLHDALPIFRAEERIGVDGIPVPLRAVDGLVADLDERPADRHLADHLARDAAGGDAHRRLARGGAPAAAVVVDAVRSEEHTSELQSRGHLGC